MYKRQLRVRRDHVPCDLWERQGVLMTTEGNVVHYGYIEKFIEQLDVYKRQAKILSRKFLWSKQFVMAEPKNGTAVQIGRAHV